MQENSVDKQDSESTENLLKAVETFTPVAVEEEKKFLVYCDSEDGIACISSSEQEEFKEFECYLFDKEDVLDFLLGTKNPCDYFVFESPEDCKCKIVEKKHEISYMIKLDRFLIEIPEGKVRKPIVMIENDVNTRVLTFDISERLRKKLKENLQLSRGREVSIGGETELVFFFTEKDNPNFLIHKVTVPIFRLLGNRFRSEYKIDLDETSIFTKKLLASYQYEVV